MVLRDGNPAKAELPRWTPLRRPKMRSTPFPSVGRSKGPERHREVMISGKKPGWEEGYEAATVSSYSNWVLRTLPLLRAFSSPLSRASRADLSALHTPST